MTPFFFLAPVAYLLVVLFVLGLCKTAKRSDDLIEGWRNRDGR